jgi:hypothetical protein
MTEPIATGQSSAARKTRAGMEPDAGSGIYMLLQTFPGLAAR